MNENKCVLKHVNKSSSYKIIALSLKTFPLKCLVDMKKASTFASAIEKQTVLR